jgi:hypothetical protein
VAADLCHGVAHQRDGVETVELAREGDLRADLRRIVESRHRDEVGLVLGDSLRRGDVGVVRGRPVARVEHCLSATQSEHTHHFGQPDLVAEHHRHATDPAVGKVARVEHLPCKGGARVRLSDELEEGEGEGEEGSRMSKSTLLQRHRGSRSSSTCGFDLHCTHRRERLARSRPDELRAREVGLAVRAGEGALAIDEVGRVEVLVVGSLDERDAPAAHSGGTCHQREELA